MASTSQIRAWWAPYECNPTRYTRVTFPGNGRTWSLLVASPARPVWEAVAQIMMSEPYLFREAAGGTYNCRPPSLHAYGLALDLNPSVNPHKNPLQTDMPPSFIARMEGIRANGKQALTWGGRWTAPSRPDAMHYQINVPPGDIDEITWDKGGDMGNWAKPGDEPKDVEDMHSVHAWQGNEVLTDADIDYWVEGQEEIDMRWKMGVTKVVNVMMKP